MTMPAATLRNLFPEANRSPDPKPEKLLRLDTAYRHELGTSSSISSGFPVRQRPSLPEMKPLDPAERLVNTVARCASAAVGIGDRQDPGGGESMASSGGGAARVLQTGPGCGQVPESVGSRSPGHRWVAHQSKLVRKCAPTRVAQRRVDSKQLHA